MILRRIADGMATRTGVSGSKVVILYKITGVVTRCNLVAHRGISAPARPVRQSCPARSKLHPSKEERHILLIPGMRGITVPIKETTRYRTDTTGSTTGTGT